MSTNVTTQYPDLVKAAQAQRLPLDQVFGKVITAPDGSIEASYPLVKLVSGVIPTSPDGHVIPSTIKVAAAKFLAGIHGDDVASQGIQAKAAKTAGLKAAVGAKAAVIPHDSELT